MESTGESRGRWARERERETERERGRERGERKSTTEQGRAEQSKETREQSAQTPIVTLLFSANACSSLRPSLPSCSRTPGSRGKTHPLHRPRVLRIFFLETIEHSLQGFNFERYVQSGISPASQLVFGTIYCCSLAALPWMLQSEKQWIHRDLVLMLDLGTDSFYALLFPISSAVIALVARGIQTEEEGAFWVETVR